MDFGQVIGTAISNRDGIISIVKGVRALFGKSKSGPEKLQIAKESVKQLPAVAKLLESVTGKDLVNDPLLEQLLTEATQCGYNVVKLYDQAKQEEDRIEAIIRQIKELKGTGEPLKQ